MAEGKLTDQELARRKKMEDLRAKGIDPFGHRYDVTSNTKEIKEKYEGCSKEELEEKGVTVRIAGRIMAKRRMGKIGFINLQDRFGQIQIYLRKDVMSDDDYELFKAADLGDIIGIEGTVCRTDTGMLSVLCKVYTHLVKALKPLPEKFHGLTDVETRYRQRYLDLIMNQDVMDTMVKRSQIVQEIREFLTRKQFIEVETPILVENAGGASARPFVTHYNALNEERKLRISLELYLKRLIVGGMERVYEIGRVFRNEGVDGRHNPEFTLMELYQAYTDYYGMMDLTEELYRDVAQKVCGTTQITYGDHVIDLGKPFRRLTMVDAIKEETGIDFDQVKTDEEAKKLADEHQVEYEPYFGKGEIESAFFDTYCEAKMIQPTFIMDHPLSISPLTKKHPDDPEKVQRFELFVNGWEMANAYTELNDPIDQRARFAHQDELAAAGDEEADHTDEDFLNAMEYGMAPMGGIGYGIDRFVMLLTNAPAIRDVLLFPTLKSVKNPGEKAKSEPASTNSADDAKGFFTPNEKIDFSNVKIEDFLADQVDFDTFQKSDFRAVKVKDCKAVPKSKKLLQFTLDDGSGTDRTILSGIHAYYEPEELIGKTLIAIINLPPRRMMGIDSCGMIISAVNDRNGEEELHVLMVDNHIPAGAKLC